MKTLSTLKRDSRGFSLIETMVVVGIISIIAMVMAQTLSSIRNEVVSLSEKMGSLSVKSLITSVLADGRVCKFEIANSGQTINSTSINAVKASNITVNQIRSLPNAGSGNIIEISKPLSPDSPSTSVTSIKLQDFDGTNLDDYFTANWVVSFTSSRPLKPLVIPMRVKLDRTNPAAATLSHCMTTELETRRTVSYNFNTGNNNSFGQTLIPVSAGVHTVTWTGGRATRGGGGFLGLYYVPDSLGKPADFDGAPPWGTLGAKGVVLPFTPSTSGTPDAIFNSPTFPWLILIQRYGSTDSIPTEFTYNRQFTAPESGYIAIIGSQVASMGSVTVD